MVYDATISEPATDRPAPAAEPVTFEWPKEGVFAIPDWVYTSRTIYEREVERIFRGPTWNFVGLEVEIPNPGDFRRAHVGPIPVITVRGKDGRIHVVENRCAHRGTEFCRERRGNAREFVCPYHQWQYDLEGNLAGIPFRRGLKGKGGMPADFDFAAHGLRKLRVAALHGLVFASFASDVEPLARYLGPEVLDEIATVFEGRQVKVLGRVRQRIECNWKLYHENIRDPYHATLLHVFLVTFGLLRADQVSRQVVGSEGRHAIMCSAKGEQELNETTRQLNSFKAGFTLKAPQLLDYAKEDRGPWSVAIQSIWPNFAVQREINTLAVREIIPNGPDEFYLYWTFFGYEGDAPEMTRQRLRQANLMGPAGLVSLDDGEVMEFVQSGLRKTRASAGVIRLGGDEMGSTDHYITEAALRSLYAHYRQAMGL